MEFVGAMDKEELIVPYELFGGNEEIPTSFFYDDGKVNHQGLTQETKYCCVFFGEANAINELRAYKKIPGEVSGDELANYAERIGVLDRKVGAYLIDGPKISKQLGYIDGYAQCNSLQDIKRALINQGPIGFGTNKVNWEKTSQPPYIMEVGESYGHKMIIVGYNDEKEVLIVENSYGKDKFDKGRFYIKYKDFDTLFFTKTAIFINDSRFKKLDDYLKLTKSMNMQEFHKQYYETETNALNKMLKRLAMQIRYIGKINTLELKELLK